MEFYVATTDGSYRLEANVRLIGDDLLVAVWGGDKPHIGAVAVAQPRPSLRPPHDKISASASVICLLGHKDDIFAKAAAESLAAAINRPVVVSAGMHWDQIDAGGIERVGESSQQLIALILQELTSRKIISD
jgi:gallate decarboxylase subunit D